MNNAYRINFDEKSYSFDDADYEQYATRMQYYNLEVLSPEDLRIQHIHNANASIGKKTYDSPKNAQIRMNQLKNTYYFFDFYIEEAELVWKRYG